MSDATGLRFAVLGDPVAHSRSPMIHTVLLELSGLDGLYTAIRADTTVLGTMIDELRAGEWSGLNVTMPLKGAAARAADTLSDDASRAGSVNTLGLRDGSVFGETTDCKTFRALAGGDRFEEEAPVLILGAGGSAAAALVAMHTSRTCYVMARRHEQARRLSERIGGDAADWGTPVPGALVVNTTPLGMRGESLPSGLVDESVGLIDLPYGSEETPAVSDARRLGLPTVGGHEFLVRQAMSSFELWTGVDLAYEAVETSLRNT